MFEYNEKHSRQNLGQPTILLIFVQIFSFLISFNNLYRKF